MWKQMLVLMVLSMVLWFRLPAARAATFTVSNLNDSGAGSLRQAVLDANTTPGLDIISFSISGTVTLTSGQMTIDDGVTIDGSGQTVTVSGNNASRVFYVNSGVTVNMTNLTITQGNDSSIYAGAGIYNGGTLMLTNCTISNNVATQWGAGIRNFGTLSVINSTFTGNAASGGGAIGSNYTGSITITGSTFSGNSASNSGGGAIINGAGPMTISDSSFYNNQANSAGAISNVGGTININSSTFYDNTVTFEGGAIFTSGTMTITNSTFYHNQSVIGGAISQWGTALNLISSTFYNNQTTGGTNSGGTIYNRTGTTTARGTIFADAPDSHCFVYEGSFVSEGNNLSDNNTCASYFTQPGDLNNVNPLLGTLGSNGGATQTIPLLAGSPALNAYSTNCPATDQRGVVRPQGAACDIGAFEAEPVTESSISENEFYAALETARTGYPDIQRVVVDFVPGAMNLTVVTATAGVGNVSIAVTQQDGFVTFNIASITVNGMPAPASYTAIINGDVPNLLVLALDSLVTERFGGGADVQAMTLTASALVVEIGG